jgi:transcriptional regulator with XRE-family HTH domain
VSKDYYTRLEQGRQAAPSGAVLEALAAALQLDGAERLHLYGLARTAAAPAGKAGRGVQAVRPVTYRLMELLAEAPAILLGRRTDILAVNDAARAVFTNFSALPARERNAAHWILLDPDARPIQRRTVAGWHSSSTAIWAADNPCRDSSTITARAAWRHGPRGPARNRAGGDRVRDQRRGQAPGGDRGTAHHGRGLAGQVGAGGGGRAARRNGIRGTRGTGQPARWQLATLEQHERRTGQRPAR